MRTIEKILPAGFRFRELWLPEQLNNSATLPSAVAGGQKLTLTGARNGTTTDGVHFTGAATSNINLGALHNNAVKFWVSFRFKLDANHAAGSPLQRMFYKKNGAFVDYLGILLRSDTGQLRFEKGDGGVSAFGINSAEVAWVAGTWYHVLASISSVNGARLRINNGVAVTDANVSALAAAGTMVIGDESDPGAGSGFIGIISDVFIGTDDLTTAEETDLYKGVPPADAVNAYPLDEGLGTTVVDRGSGGNNGTLGSACTWAYGPCKQAAMSTDGINDYAASSAGVNISGALTLITVLKNKSTRVLTNPDKNIVMAYISGTDNISLTHFNNDGYVSYRVVGGGVDKYCSDTFARAIGSYEILGLTYTGGVVTGYSNGVAVATVSAGGVVSAAAATLYIGANSIGGGISNEAVMAQMIINGALSAAQVKTFSRTLDQMLNLGIGV